jgi:hypothetical protein
MFIKDIQTGKVRKYGTNPHDSLLISEDGKTLSYLNLQFNEGSLYGDFCFVTDEKGLTPSEDESIKECGEAYFNIGGFGTEYFPPCVDCNTKMDEIRKAFDKIRSQEPCEDEISREAVIEALRNRTSESIIECINAIPSVRVKQ